MKATGTPKCFSKRLNISEAWLYRLIDTVKEMGSPGNFIRIRKAYTTIAYWGTFDYYDIVATIISGVGTYFLMKALLKNSI